MNGIYISDLLACSYNIEILTYCGVLGGVEGLETDSDQVPNGLENLRFLCAKTALSC
jgi:hypothetical protein